MRQGTPQAIRSFVMELLTVLAFCLLPVLVDARRPSRIAR